MPAARSGHFFKRKADITLQDSQFPDCRHRHSWRYAQGWSLMCLSCNQQQTLTYPLCVRCSPSGAPPGIKSAATAPPAGPGLSSGSSKGTTKLFFGWSSRTSSAPTETLPNPDVMFGSADSSYAGAPPSSGTEARVGSVSNSAYSSAPHATPPSVASTGPQVHSEARATRRCEAAVAVFNQ